MKILFPLQVFFPSQAGGTANAAYWLTKNLCTHGFSPTIVSTDQGIGSEIPLDKWLQNESGRVIYVRTLFTYVPLRQTLVAFRHLLSADVVHLSSFFFPTAFIIGLAARILGKKIAWSAHGELDTYALSISRVRKRPVLWLLRNVVGTYPMFHSTCDEETNFIKLSFGSNARVCQITNYVEIAPKSTRTPGKYFLFIGRLHQKKGLDNLIRALAISQAFMISDLVLKIAGDGSLVYQKTLADLVNELGLNEKVEFVGHVEGEAKSRLYSNAHFTFMPSHSENFGLVVLESLAQETPVVASIHTPWESLEKEKVGFWIDNSPEALASTIDKILAMDQTEYEGFRSRSRDFVVNSFDIKRNFDQWLEFYRLVCERKEN